MERYFKDRFCGEYELRIKKDGKPGSSLMWVSRPITPVNHCEVCGLLGTPRKVCVRHDVYGWNRSCTYDDSVPSKDILCTGCWNRARAIVRKQRSADESKAIINKIERLIRHERKNQNDRATS